MNIFFSGMNYYMQKKANQYSPQSGTGNNPSQSTQSPGTGSAPPASAPQNVDPMQNQISYTQPMPAEQPVNVRDAYGTNTWTSPFGQRTMFNPGTKNNIAMSPNSQQVNYSFKPKYR